MQAWVTDSLERLSSSPQLQGALAAVCTFILEDPTTVGCALLVADGKMTFLTALIGLSLGIALGDWGLYALGRFVGPKTVTWGWVSQRRLDRAGSWFERNLVATIFISRFIPGLRLPTNLGAGIMHASPARYLPVALIASLVWTLITLSAVSKAGELLLPLLGTFKWPIGIAIVIVLVVWQLVSMRKIEQRVAVDRPEDGQTASFFEFWPPALFYAPVAVYYAWLSLRYRSLTLPTATNPTIYSGGMIRESKTEILDLVPEPQKQWFATHAHFEVPFGESSESLVAAAFEVMTDAKVSLPIVAKPDQGQRGDGVRPIMNVDDLERYLREFPEGAAVCLQELADYAEELGVLYHRFPGENRGTFTSVTAKEFPKVQGDGSSTLRQLIEEHPRASLRKSLFFARHTDELERVLSKGEIFSLVFAGNHKQGCVFRDGKDLLSPALEDRLDEIAQAIPGLHFCRFDLRYKTLESLQRGEGFKIVEINGAGAEATHIWDPNARLGDAYQALFEQFRVLFAIGDANRSLGHRPLGPVRFLKDVLLYHKVARKYPVAE